MPMQMQEELGVKARREGREWLMTRVPARLFGDYSAKGALFTVCVGCMSNGRDEFGGIVSGFDW